MYTHTPTVYINTYIYIYIYHGVLHGSVAAAAPSDPVRPGLRGT